MFGQRLRAYVGDRLPPFMIPSTVHVVDELPLNRNGKVDRTRLTAATVDHRAEPPATPTEHVVAEVWRDVLGVPFLGRRDGFSSHGGQSIEMVRAVATLQSRLGIPAERAPLLVRAMLAAPTLRQFAHTADEIASGHGGAETVDFHAEACLAPAMDFHQPLTPNILDPEHVLLTGATGFLGPFLLDRLLRRTHATIHCLVRATDDRHARARITANLRRFGLPVDETDRRVATVCGDLSQPDFGLSAERFGELAHVVDVIVHNGAHVNFVYPYAALRATNVDGTRTVLRLATSHQRKAIHYVSTVSTLLGDGRDCLPEDELPQHPEKITMGYAQTKWVSEGVLRQASRRGLPVSIHRPHEITGTAGGGVWATGSLLAALIRSIVDTGTAPDVRLPLNLLPVDFVADAIVHVVRSERPRGATYNMTNDRPAELGLLVERLRARGHAITLLPYAEWLRTCVDHATASPDFPLAPFLPMLADETSGAMSAMHIGGTFRTDNFDSALANSGLRCPPVDEALIDRYLDYFAHIGFLT